VHTIKQGPTVGRGVVVANHTCGDQHIASACQDVASRNRSIRPATSMAPASCGSMLIGMMLASTTTHTTTAQCTDATELHGGADGIGDCVNPMPMTPGASGTVTLEQATCTQTLTGGTCTPTTCHGTTPGTVTPGTCTLTPDVDCDESTADASTCTAEGQELYSLTTPASGGGAACTGSSTLCVAGDGSIPRNCVEVTLHPNYCTTVGQELYTLTTAAAGGGTACTGSSTLCAAGDGSIPRNCVETTADASTCTAIGQELYTLTTPAANGGTACTGSSTLCAAGDGSIPPTEICAECEVCATPTPAPCPAGSSGRRRQLQPVEAAQSLIPFLAPLLAVVGIAARFQ
jgi:hypothetical protein